MEKVLRSGGWIIGAYRADILCMSIDGYYNKRELGLLM